MCLFEGRVDKKRRRITGEVRAMSRRVVKGLAVLVAVDREAIVMGRSMISTWVVKSRAVTKNVSDV